MSSEYVSTLERQRQRKEEYFAEHPHSPIPSDEQASFPGLAFFPIDDDYRFELPLHEHDEKERITVETTAGGEQEYLRWGEFRFELGGERYTLQAYRPTDGGDRLWVPFRDETNEETTYGAGRYLDLEPEEHRTEDETWILDFNEAYNPTCAYNKAYECPLIPMENWLDVSIEAGEKDYPGDPIEPDHQHHH
ncbi:MAG: DUF1684 domain-containing protein [Halobacteriales archaeon]|nr:DUF1684 domain-containing protein [Halobacteriales archaeon]